jgi:DNA-binding transcriptional ArsR family regulator
MDVPARTDDVLARPTRARLFSVLVELPRPVGTEELAALVGLHPNGVRVHLERLRQAGLVERERRSSAPGTTARSVDDCPGCRARAGATSGARVARTLARANYSLGALELAKGRIHGAVGSAGNLSPDGDAAAETKMRATLTGLGFNRVGKRISPQS